METTPAIRIFGKPSPQCKYCDLAKNALALAGIPFEYIDITAIPVAKEYVLQVWQEQGKPATVPLIEVDKEHIGGYKELLQYLETSTTESTTSKE